MALPFTQFSQNANKEMLNLLRQLGDNDQTSEIGEKIREIFLREYAFIKDALDSSTIVAVTNKAGIIAYVNDKFCEISQYSREELIGSTHRLLNSGYHSPNFFKEMWTTILSGEIWCGDVKNLKKDGSYYWVHTNIIPIINNVTNQVEQFIALRTDITKGKEAEEELRKVIQNDFERTIRSLDNMVFKIKKDRYGDFIITLVEGKLSKLLDISEGIFDQKRIEDFFGTEIANEALRKCEAAFRGEKHSIKHHYNGIELYTTLSPIIENGTIIEIIGNSNDITLLELAQKEIHHLAYHDDLTDLPNRRKLTKDLQEKLNHISNQKFAVLFVDIDRFKQINDTLGFNRGDKLILELSQRLKQFISGLGTIYRSSGDEYVIILEKYKNDSILSRQVQELLKIVEEPMLIDGYELMITCSVGVTTFPNDEDSAEKILNRVETALKHCKLNGRQGFIFYNEEMAQNTKERLNLEINLRKAIINDELTLHYQPKYILNSNQMDGMEALVRWYSPVYGFVSPNEFIQIAEDTGLIVQLGEWVLYNACKQNKKWINNGYPPRRVAVNVSAIELLRPNYVDRVKRILKETKLDPQYLELEITENSVMRNLEKGIQILQELKSLGIFIAIDDFGTGYSSFGYLKQLPINILKIDKYFIQEIDKSEIDANIVKSMIQLGHTFHLKVIAEGVETKRAAEILRDLNCDIVQGYYFSKPIPADMFEKLL
ncbi:PAS domain S-box/diguanylate cyclase (GGDEF) domain-containing protein [Schinkia azotoformans MEV2011]|uniref:PAS domain S-box/diguanylate cyclase (GGDEF) domain-containing protein n=1 Tax=Schinkia azotoformans MEV2011 TaxID=1348973 RepID=A0A072NQK3_SCHAZ|nr:EAL domain-containing protein [Schinkia azotoformans]KEF39143.1 PAS domain S-box/diguanylate cyclase (GGDEF) domain-containing protein [Schinkia azotoformans MEV2011]MEC1717619.1 EAL domain-containing protein [Schinkia azotoformans]MEC1747391.1 EAL domain-containing protein [Schinkia azotoformans]MEC1758301.1 EAL domain-containing protein [Schinkia azotoformans]MED4376721.1 EAL domain-containing protein [Schinkia azotoformans]